MDWRIFFDIGAGIAIAVVGWLARELWGAVKELRDDLNELRVALPTQYVNKDDFKSGVQEIKTMLEKISDKLDAKADKS
jgi:hypothetical protein